jgi:hypothetical protein
MRRESKKRLDEQLVSDRNAKRKDLEAEYDGLQVTAEEINWPWGLSSKKEWVDQKLQFWEGSYPKKPFGKYQDLECVTARYQQAFVLQIQLACPEILEELREMVPGFGEVFGPDGANFNKLLDREKGQLLDFDFSFEQRVNWILQTPGVEFRPFRSMHFRYDHPWGEYRLPLTLLLLSTVRTNIAERTAGLLEFSVDQISKEIVITPDRLPEAYRTVDHAQLKRLLASHVVEKLVVGGEREDFIYIGQRSLMQFLTGIVSNPDLKVSSFLQFIIPLLEWLDRHRLHKDWLLRYALFLVRRVSEAPDTKLSDTEIPLRDVASLRAYPFEFKFDGWSAGEERRQDYERRLKNSFDESLNHYFHHVHSFLDLDEIKRVTVPLKYDRVKWLVRWTVQGRSKPQIIKEVEADKHLELGKEKYIDFSTIDKAFRQFRNYDLPVRD